MLRRTGSIKLATILGIRVGVDASWFIVLALVMYALSSSFRRTLASSDTVAYLTAVASALLFFASIVLHELGHAVAARREGITTARIDLWFFGGLARLSRDSRTPGEEARIAAAGPVVTLIIILLCGGAVLLAAGPHDYLDTTGFHHEGAVTPLLLLLTWVGSINVVLLLFNLIPAYPLDGGRLARALIWRLTGDRGRATRAAARVGQLFAYLMIGYGLVLLASGAIGGLYLIVLGFLFGSSARAAILQSAAADRMGQVRVADIMDPEPVSVPAELSLEHAKEDYFLRYGWSWFPVVDPAGCLVGLLREDSARGGGPDPVSSAMAVPDGWRVGTDRSLDELMSSEPLHRLGGLVAVDPEGRVCGVVTLGQVRRAIAGALRPPFS